MLKDAEYKDGDNIKLAQSEVKKAFMACGQTSIVENGFNRE
jgi:hypothetical protein